MSGHDVHQRTCAVESTHMQACLRHMRSPMWVLEAGRNQKRHYQREAIGSKTWQGMLAWPHLKMTVCSVKDRTFLACVNIGTAAHWCHCFSQRSLVFFFPPIQASIGWRKCQEEVFCAAVMIDLLVVPATVKGLYILNRLETGPHFLWKCIQNNLFWAK